ncbi:MAG: hypothetical protein ACFWTY_11270 [Shouchella clausii]|jgi:hypothetical protein
MELVEGETEINHYHTKSQVLFYKNNQKVSLSMRIVILIVLSRA